MACKTVSEMQGLIVEVADIRKRAIAQESSEPLTTKLPSYLVRINGGLVKIEEVSAGEIKGQALLPLSSDAAAAGGTWEIVSYVTPEAYRRVKDIEIAWIRKLQEQGRVENTFNWSFFQTGDSREPEQAGILGAVVGSFFTLIVTLMISFPIGVLAATYLEEFAPKNRCTDIIEVNIQQSGGRAVHRLRIVGPGGVPEPIRPASLRPARWRHGAGLDDAANDYYRRACGLEIGAAIHSAGCIGCWGFPFADGDPSCVAAGNAGNPDRDDHLHGPSAGRNRAAADDRHGGVYRRRAWRLHRSGNCDARTDLSLGRQSRTGICG